jgi:hypothetical protein
MSPSPFTDALQAEIATLQAQHPILAGALDKAYTLVAGGGVFPLDDGRTAHVRSQSNPTLSHLVNGTCDCKATQYHAAPCAHRLAFRVYQRTVERMTGDAEEERWEPTPAPEPLPLPEAPASVNVRLQIAGREVQWTLRDRDEGRLAVRLETLLAQYPLPQPAPETAQVPRLSPQQHNAAAMHRSVSGFCPVHNVQMQENHGKDGRTWQSHFDEQAGRWCKGR